MAGWLVNAPGPRLKVAQQYSAKPLEHEGPLTQFCAWHLGLVSGRSEAQATCRICLGSREPGNEGKAKMLEEWRRLHRRRGQEVAIFATSSIIFPKKRDAIGFLNPLAPSLWPSFSHVLGSGVGDSAAVLFFPPRQPACCSQSW